MDSLKYEYKGIEFFVERNGLLDYTLLLPSGTSRHASIAEARVFAMKWIDKKNGGVE